ncbi:MAG TPA: hypothetical protein VF516_28545 [Kofleriaceae bacterium]
MTSSPDAATAGPAAAIDPLPPALSSMWRLCKLGYRREPRLMLVAAEQKLVVDRRGAVARVEGGRVDPSSVRRHGERAGRITEQREDRDRIAPERAAQVVRVEHPDVWIPPTSGTSTSRLIVLSKLSRFAA